MFELAVGLRENPDNEVRLFLDEDTIPRSLRSEPALDDPGFVEVGPWISTRSILRPRSSEIAKRLGGFDVALVTELGPIFAAASRVPFVFIPTGWDLTCGPFPVRSRSSRNRGVNDLSALAVAYRLRLGIRTAIGIWGPRLLHSALLRRGWGDSSPTTFLNRSIWRSSTRVGSWWVAERPKGIFRSFTRPE